MPEDSVAFGEVAHAPPKVTLKRRHWDEEQVQAAHKRQQQNVLKRQMHEAAARVQKRSAAASAVSPLQVRLLNCAQCSVPLRQYCCCPVASPLLLSSCVITAVVQVRQYCCCAPASVLLLPSAWRQPQCSVRGCIATNTADSR